MAENSKIEWCDMTWNPWIGCTRVSPGCQHCYAETMMDKRYGKVKWGPQGARIRTSADYWKQPAKWNRAAEAEGVRRRVFCASLADVFEIKEDQYDELRSWRLDLFDLIEATPMLDWLVLTKRPDVARAAVPTRWLRGWPANVWIGASVENQEYADKRIPHLLKIPAAVRFLSVEPLLGAVDLSAYLTPQFYSEELPSPRFGYGYPPTMKAARLRPSVNWVIVGGESGHGARAMHSNWVRNIRDQCQEAGVPFFFKQWGAAVPFKQRENPDGPIGRGTVGVVFEKAGQSQLDPGWEGNWWGYKKHTGRLLDGREWNEFPETAVSGELDGGSDD